MLQMLKERADTFVTWHGVITKHSSAVLMKCMQTWNNKRIGLKILNASSEKCYSFFSLKYITACTKWSSQWSQDAPELPPSQLWSLLVAKDPNEGQIFALCLVSHAMLEKKSYCKVAPKGRNANLPYWSENIWVTWNIKQVTYHKYTISKMQLYKNRNPGKDNPQALYHLQATLFLYCQLFTFRAASPNLMYNMPLALHFVFIQNSYCSSKWNH